MSVAKIVESARTAEQTLAAVVNTAAEQLEQVATTTLPQAVARLEAAAVAARDRLEATHAYINGHVAAQVAGVVESLTRLGNLFSFGTCPALPAQDEPEQILRPLSLEEHVVLRADDEPVEIVYQAANPPAEPPADPESPEPNDAKTRDATVRAEGNVSIPVVWERIDHDTIDSRCGRFRLSRVNSRTWRLHTYDAVRSGWLQIGSPGTMAQLKAAAEEMASR